MNVFKRNKEVAPQIRPASAEGPKQRPIETRHLEHVFFIIERELKMYKNAPLIDGKIDEFDTDKLLLNGNYRSPRHKPGFMREARFRDGLWVAMTTKNTLSTSAHLLTIPYRGNGQPTYTEKVIERDDQAIGRGDHTLVGMREIAGPEGLTPFVLGKIALSLEIEGANNWPGVVTSEVAERFRIKTPEIA